MPGSARPGTIWEEVPVLGLTDWFYDMAIVAAPSRSDLSDSHFAEALSQAVRDLATLADFDRETRLLALAAFGDYSYAPAGGRRTGCHAASFDHRMIRPMAE